MDEIVRANTQKLKDHHDERPKEVSELNESIKKELKKM